MQLLYVKFYKLLIFLEKYFLSCLCNNFNLSFFLSFYNAFWLIYYNPMIFSVSVKSVCLILRSIGDDELKDGHTLTSISHGFSLLSIKISKPYN